MAELYHFSKKESRQTPEIIWVMGELSSEIIFKLSSTLPLTVCINEYSLSAPELNDFQTLQKLIFEKANQQIPFKPLTILVKLHPFCEPRYLQEYLYETDFVDQLGFGLWISSLKTSLFSEDFKNLTEDSVVAIAEQLECAHFLYLNETQLNTTQKNENYDLALKLNPKIQLISLGSLDSLDSSHPSLDPTFFSSFKNDLSEYATWESLCELAYEQKKFTLLESLPKTTGVAYYFHRKTPFHTERLLSLFEQWPISCIRTVGTLWLNSDIKTAFGISQFMNHQLFISEEGAWFIDQIKTHHHSYETFWDEYPELEQIWDTQLGDKRNEIVFIFDRQPSSHWMEALEKALLTEEELTVPLKRTSLDEPSSLKIETVTSEQKKQLESDRHNVIKIY